MITPVQHRKHLQWAHEHQNWTMEQWKKAAWSDESQFILKIRWMVGACAFFIFKATGCTMGRPVALAYQLVFFTINTSTYKPFGINCTDDSCTIRPGTILIFKAYIYICPHRAKEKVQSAGSDRSQSVFNRQGTQNLPHHDHSAGRHQH
jgi:hypothetical protein